MHNRLEQIAGQVGQRGPLPFFQRDVSIDRLIHHPADQVAQPVGQGVQVGMVDLLNVAREDDFGPVAGPRDDRLDLVRGQVLGLVDDQVCANEWPGTPRFDDHTEIWAYQAAIDHQLYPRKTEGKGKKKELPLTPTNLRSHCWPHGSSQLAIKDLERFARGIWSDLSRPRLETLVREGLTAGEWSVWETSAAEAFFTRDDQPSSPVQVGASWVLVDPNSPLAQELDVLRPGRGPQPIDLAGTPGPSHQTDNNIITLALSK
jgi:hypothetical protein